MPVEVVTHRSGPNDTYEDGDEITVDPTGHLHVLYGDMPKHTLAIYAPNTWVKAKLVKVAQS